MEVQEVGAPSEERREVSVRDWADSDPVAGNGSGLQPFQRRRVKRIHRVSAIDQLISLGPDRVD
jgi:hypothetical protein